jgi:hypothetical protein
MIGIRKAQMLMAAFLKASLVPGSGIARKPILGLAQEPHKKKAHPRVPAWVSPPVDRESD